MKYSEYIKISRLLNSLADVEHYYGTHKSIDKNTLLSIFSQRNQLHNKKQSKVLRANLQAIITDYDNGTTIISIASNYNCSACELLRLILEHKYNYIKAKATEIINKPQLLVSLHNDTRLSSEIPLILESDPGNSPAITKIKLSIGVEYETKLKDELKKNNIEYLDEDELKAQQYSKTPDIKLTVPIAININNNYSIVNWIDSKASFGDLLSLHKYQQQFQSYVNRFGHGLVIFWFDFIQDWKQIKPSTNNNTSNNNNNNTGDNTNNRHSISNELQLDGVLIMNRFPELHEIKTLSTPEQRKQLQLAIQRDQQLNGEISDVVKIDYQALKITKEMMQLHSPTHTYATISNLTNNDVPTIDIAKLSLNNNNSNNNKEVSVTKSPVSKPLVRRKPKPNTTPNRDNNNNTTNDNNNNNNSFNTPTKASHIKRLFNNP